MRAETQASVEAIRKSLNLIAQRMDWDTAPHRLEEMNAMIEDGDLYASAWSVAGFLGMPGRGEVVRIGEDAFAE